MRCNSNSAWHFCRTNIRAIFQAILLVSGPMSLGVLALTGQAQIPCPLAGLCAAVIAAVAALLAAFCQERSWDGSQHQLHYSQHQQPVTNPSLISLSPSSSSPRLVAAWFVLLGHLAAAATCCRAMSALMDYVGGGRARAWILDHFSNINHQHIPDLVALGIALATATLFAFGLEMSGALRGLLIACVITCLGILTAATVVRISDLADWTPSMRTTTTAFTSIIETNDTSWEHSLSAILGGAAVMRYGFIGVERAARTFRTSQSSQKSFRQWTTVAVSCTLCLLAHGLVVLLIALLATDQEALQNSEVILAQVLELRDLAAARLTIAIVAVSGLAIALVDITPHAHGLVLALAGDDWHLLPKWLVSWSSGSLGTPIGSAFAVGFLVGISACLCPLKLLVQIVALGPLLEHLCAAWAITRDRSRPPDPPPPRIIDKSRISSTLMPSMNITTTTSSRNKVVENPLANNRSSLMVANLKTGLNTLPSQLMQEEEMDRVVHSPSTATLATLASSDMASELTEDEDQEDEELEFEEEPSSSETDIDAFVAEYRQRVHILPPSRTTSVSWQNVAVASRRRSNILRLLGLSSLAVAGAGAFLASATMSSFTIWPTLTFLISISISVVSFIAASWYRQSHQRIRSSDSWLIFFIAIGSFLINATLIGAPLAAGWPIAFGWTLLGICLSWRRVGRRAPIIWIKRQLSARRRGPVCSERIRLQSSRAQHMHSCVTTLQSDRVDTVLLHSTR